jgi:Rieske Fe-S protein
MPEEEQERFEDYEDYVELERYIAQLQADRKPRFPPRMTRLRARIYRMAALFRAAAPGAAEPDPAFAARLRARLQQELAAQRQTPQETAIQPPSEPSHAPSAAAETTEAVAPTGPAPVPGAGRFRPRVSRRSLLTGGAVAAASLAAGAGLERALQQVIVPGSGNQSGSPTTPPSSSQPYPPLIGADVPSTWHFVIDLAQLGSDPVRFVTETVAGYVIRQPSSQGSSYDANWGEPSSATGSDGEIIAFSAACTHMGCLVEWQATDRKFHCPCHGGIFTASGQADATIGRLRYLAPLPRLDTKIEHGKIYVRVPGVVKPS